MCLISYGRVPLKRNVFPMLASYTQAAYRVFGCCQGVMSAIHFIGNGVYVASYLFMVKFNFVVEEFHTWINSVPAEFLGRFLDVMRGFWALFTACGTEYIELNGGTRIINCF